MEFKPNYKSDPDSQLKPDYKPEYKTDFQMYDWSPHDRKDKVIKDSLIAIERNRKNMSPEELKHAYAQMCFGLGPTNISQLCDRKSTNTFQG